MTRPEIEALHRALREQLALKRQGHEGALYEISDSGEVYIQGCFDLAPLVDAVLGASPRPEDIRRELLLELADELAADAKFDRDVAFKVPSKNQGVMHMSGAARQSQWAQDLRKRAMEGTPPDAIGVGTTTLDMWRFRALDAEAELAAIKTGDSPAPA